MTDKITYLIPDPFDPSQMIEVDSPLPDPFNPSGSGEFARPE